MTNALALDSQNNQKDVILSLLQTSQAQDKTNANDISGNTTFNNVLNNLNATTKTAQSDLEKTLLKTNTNSAVKELSYTKNSSKKVSNTQKNAQNSIQKNTQQNSQSVCATNQEKNIKQTKTNDISNNNQTNIQTENQKASAKETLNQTAQKTTSEDINKSEAKTEIKENNNSSFPSPSPVFTSENIKENNTIQKEDIVEEIENLLASLTITQDINLDINSDLVSEIEDKISQITTIEEINTTVEEITNFLNNSSLNNSDKENILSTLEDIKNLISQNKDIKTNFEETLKEVKQTLQSALTDTLFDVTKQIKIQDITKENDILSSNLQKLQDLLKENDNEIFKEIKANLDELKNSFEKEEIKIDDNEILDFENETKITNEKIENLISKLENEENVDLSEIKEVCKDINETLKETLKNSENENISLDNSDETLKTAKETEKNIELKTDFKEISTTEIKETNKVSTNEIDTNVFEKIETFDTSDIDKKDLSEILDIFKNVDSSDIELDNEAKTQIKDMISAIEENENSIDIKDIQEKSANIITELKTIFKEEKTVSADLKISSATTQDVSETSNENLFEIPKEDISQNTISQNKENIIQEDNQAISNLNTNNELDFSVETQDTQSYDINLDETNIATKSENIDKKTFIQDTLKDILIDIDYEAQTPQSGTLTVSDEIVKMAMDEPTNLNIDTSSRGNVVYDPASNNASVIKNVNFTKNTQNIPEFEMKQNNVLGQVSDKIQQMQNNQGQKLTMVLRPNDLGRLSIELSLNHNGMTTNILAQNEDVRNYIEKNIDALKQQLSDAGVNVNTIQIKTAGQDGTSTYEGNQHQNFAQQQNENQHQNSQQQNENQNAKEKYITSLGEYVFQETKDFSNVLNQVMNYSLS